MPIATLDDVKDFVRTTLTGVEDDIITNSLSAAIGLINETTQRDWSVATTATARVYAPDFGSAVLRIHDCTSVTSVVENGATLTAGTSYQLEPLNGRSWSGQAVPYTQIRKLTGSWYVYGGQATVTVTATWGWAAIPAQIVEAVKILTKDIIDHRDIRFGTQVTDMGASRVRQASLISDLIATFRRAEAWGIG